jgi:hypothetical protein
MDIDFHILDLIFALSLLWIAVFVLAVYCTCKYCDSYNTQRINYQQEIITRQAATILDRDHSPHQANKDRIDDLLQEIRDAVLADLNSPKKGQWLRVSQTGENWTETPSFSFPVVDIKYEVAQCSGPRSESNLNPWVLADPGIRMYGRCLRVSTHTYQDAEQVLKVLLVEIRKKLKVPILRCVFEKMGFVSMQRRMLHL